MIEEKSTCVPNQVVGRCTNALTDCSPTDGKLMTQRQALRSGMFRTNKRDQQLEAYQMPVVYAPRSRFHFGRTTPLCLSIGKFPKPEAGHDLSYREAWTATP